MNPRDISDPTDAALLEAYRAAACAEADAHFDDRALDAQRQKILSRLAHLGHPARVIRFPRVSHGEVPVSRVNRRWLSVAAAAGLLIGLLGGQLVHILPQPTRRLAPMATSMAPTAPIRQFVPVAAPADDDGFLSEIENTVELRSATALRTLDELTPFHEER